MKTGRVLVSLQLYFILCLLYFLFAGIGEKELNSVGDAFYKALFYSSPLFIIGPFIYFAITRTVKYKRELAYVIPAIVITIMMFEFVLRYN